MAGIKRLFKSFYKLLSPPVVLSVIAIGVASVWLVFESSKPMTMVYLVTPEKYGQLSSRAAQVTDEKWVNQDGSQARGWLLRGIPNAPAVILLHRFSADRSHVLNLGVKLNEATNFTVLMPDQRGHGQEPFVEHSTFGGLESNDVEAAVTYLRSLRSPEQVALVGKDIGVYGLEMGALAALNAATRDETIKALVLDSVPQDSDALMGNVIGRRFPFASMVTAKFASLGAYPFYYQGGYRRSPSCETVRSLTNRRVLLLGGIDSPDFQETTSKLGKCFPVNASVDSKTDLSPSGMGMISASMEQSESYDQRVVDYLKQALTMP